MICRAAGVAAFCVAATFASDSLRGAADARGISIGTAVASRLLQQADYAAILAREFNQVEAENEMKMRATHPARDRFDFTAADAIVAFASTHNMKVRGHTLVWHRSVPEWVDKGGFTAEQLRGILRDHIRTEVSHFAGKVYAWDVVNEAIDEDGTVRHSIWADGPGTGAPGKYGYIEEAFRIAHEADPAALLFYNDYATEARNPKSDAVLEMVRTMLHDGVPVNGVGFQCHFTLSAVSKAEFMANLARFTALGLQVQITELDVRMPLDKQDLQQQARVYSDVAAACAATPHCTAIQTWGFTDRYSWIPHTFKGTGAALPFDSDYQPKPAYQSLLKALQP
jgi:endo-1,4-beta-xylanase